MKKLYALLLLCFPVLVQAQYTVQTGLQPYQALTAPTQVAWPIGWDDEEALIPIGFTLSIAGNTYDSLVLSSNGYIYTEDGSYEFNPYYVDMIGAGDETSVGYQLEGTAGNQIFKVEFSNAGFFEDTTGTARTTFQFWLFENGCWEARLGPSAIVDTFLIFEEFPGPFIGYANYPADSVLALTGPSDAPIVTPIDSIAFPSLDNVPVDGRVYTFCPTGQTTSIIELAAVPADVYPNPAQNTVTVRLPRAPITYERLIVLDIHGRAVFQTELRQLETTMQLEHLPRGVYWIQSSSNSFPGGKIVLN